MVQDMCKDKQARGSTWFIVNAISASCIIRLSSIDITEFSRESGEGGGEGRSGREIAPTSSKIYSGLLGSHRLEEANFKKFNLDNNVIVNYRERPM